MGGGLRYFGGAVAFGFAAMWIMASFAAGAVCLLSALVGYVVGFVIERMRAELADRADRRTVSLSRAPEPTMRVWADVLNSDLGHIYEPSATTSASTHEAEYGWPPQENTLITSGTLQ